MPYSLPRRQCPCWFQRGIAIHRHGCVLAFYRRQLDIFFPETQPQRVEFFLNHACEEKVCPQTRHHNRDNYFTSTNIIGSHSSTTGSTSPAPPPGEFVPPITIPG